MRSVRALLHNPAPPAQGVFRLPKLGRRSRARVSGSSVFDNFDHPLGHDVHIWPAHPRGRRRKHAFAGGSDPHQIRPCMTVNGIGKRPSLAVCGKLPTTSNNYSRNLRSLPTNSLRSLLHAASATCAAAASAASNCAASAASAAATSAAGGKLYALAELRCSGSFLVEDIERPQADVGNLLLIESNDGAEFGISRRYIRCRHGRRCAARHRPKTPRQRLVPGRPSSDASALKFASRAPC